MVYYLTAVLVVVVALRVSEPARAPPNWHRELVLWGNPTFVRGSLPYSTITFAYAGNQALLL